MTWYGHPGPCVDYTTSMELPAHGVFDISFVDDCAFGIHGTNITQVEEGIKVVVEAMVPERTDTKELKGTMPQGPPATRVASITMPEPDSWRTSMIVLIAWPLCKPASHPLVRKRLHSWMQKTSNMPLTCGFKGWWRTKAFAPPVRFSGPLLPKHDTPEACLFRVYWDVRTAQPGTSSQELQGHLATPAPTPQPKVRLFADDLPGATRTKSWGWFP